jgi:hypothetical protein
MTYRRCWGSPPQQGFLSPQNKRALCSRGSFAPASRFFQSSGKTKERAQRAIHPLVATNGNRECAGSHKPSVPNVPTRHSLGSMSRRYVTTLSVNTPSAPMPFAKMIPARSSPQILTAMVGNRTLWPTGPPHESLEFRSRSSAHVPEMARTRRFSFASPYPPALLVNWEL